MTFQFQFFERATDEHAVESLEGLRYRRQLITATDEASLIDHVRGLPFQEFDFHGYKGKRRVVSFGWQYDFSGRQLRKADDIPEFLLPLRARAASFAGIEPSALQHGLVTEYGPGAGIGWHRDKAVFGQVVGISLLSACVLRFRRKLSNSATRTTHSRAATPKAGTDSEEPAKLKREWERVNILAEPRSAYHLSGPARLEWEHSILRVNELRYSITFRTMRED